MAFPNNLSPKVTIVILNWNGLQYLRQFLPSVLASSYPNTELVVVDNASTDASVAFLREQYPKTRIIQLERNFGFAGGYNQGLKLVQSDYYVLLNSDVEVESGWIDPVIQFMESHQEVAACQPKIVSFADRGLFEYAGAAGGWLDFLGYPFARGRIFDVCEEDKHQYDSPQACFWASGAALFVRAELYHQVGGFYDFFFAHQEEIDFCWRLQLAGFSIYCCPQSVVYHVGGGTLPKNNERKVFLNFRNNLIMLAKNLNPFRAIWTIPLRLILDIISATKSLFAGELVYFLAILEAHMAFAKWVFLKRHSSGYPKRKKAAFDGWLNRSIVWQHFVLGKKTFLEIVGNNK